MARASEQDVKNGIACSKCYREFAEGQKINRSADLTTFVHVSCPLLDPDEARAMMNNLTNAMVNASAPIQKFGQALNSIAAPLSLKDLSNAIAKVRGQTAREPTLVVSSALYDRLPPTRLGKHVMVISADPPLVQLLPEIIIPHQTVDEMKRLVGPFMALTRSDELETFHGCPLVYDDDPRHLGLTQYVWNPGIVKGYSIHGARSNFVIMDEIQ